MRDQERNHEVPPAGRPPRRPYEPPAIVTEETFETMATGCNSAPSQEVCEFNPPTSSP